MKKIITSFRLPHFLPSSAKGEKALLSWILFLLCLMNITSTLGICQDQTEKTSVNETSSGDTAQFKLRTQSNLVVVRVVVRDSQGRAVENLTKENFKLLDSGQEQKISQFSIDMPTPQVEVPVASKSDTSAVLTKAIPPTAQAMPRVLALYFDDLSMGLDEINTARDAADSYLRTTLHPVDQAAIFTSSGSVHTDFTSDLKTLHEALSHVVPVPVVSECPKISDYQAYRMVEFDDPDAYMLAISDAQLRCHMFGPSSNSGSGPSGGTESTENQGGAEGGQSGSAQGNKGSAGQGNKNTGTEPSGNQGTRPMDMSGAGLSDGLSAFVKMQAQFIWAQAQRRAEQSLNGLSLIEDRIARMRGQRGIILTSPGFLSLNVQDQINRVIDRALRSQIVISSLDPKGVAMLMPELDVSSNFNPKLISSLHAFASSNELYATAALAEIAEGTGGDFFHHNNDLKVGFSRLGDPPLSYILAFAPNDLDGKFHKLRVELVQSKGTVQARRGYYAIKTERNEAAEEQEELRQIVASKEELKQLSIEVTTEITPDTADTRQLAVLIRLDLNSVRFRREGATNLNTLTFATGIYGADGKWVTGQKKQFQLKLADPQLADMRSKGVAAKNICPLKPGKYLVRTVVEDSEDHHLAALNREVEVK